MKYYDIRPIRSKNCDFNFIVSGRGPGKTTAAVNMLLEEWFERGKQFVRIGRYDWEVSKTLMAAWFNSVNYSTIHEYTGNNSDYIKFHNGEFRLHESADLYQVMGYLITLNNQDVFKSVSYDDVTNVVFDEFAMLSPRDYMVGETAAYMSALSTIVRNRQDVKAWFIGNTLDKHNPYFDMFGVDIDRIGLEPGQIRTFKCSGFGGLGATIALEYAEMSYEDASEMSPLMRISGNDTATTGAYALSPEVSEYDDRCALVPPGDWVGMLPGIEGIYCGGGRFGSVEVSHGGWVDSRPVMRVRTYRGETPPYKLRWVNLSGITRPKAFMEYPAKATRYISTVDPNILYADRKGFKELQLLDSLCFRSFEVDEFRYSWDNFIKMDGR